MDRRAFLKTTAVAGLAGFYVEPAVSRAGRPTRSTPDILLIMPDQMRGDCLSDLGHPVVRTPNFDRLASRGVLFRRAYTPVASCIPARFSLLTGLYPQTSGVVGYAAKVITTPTLPEILTQQGYATVLVGRNMHQKRESGSCGYQQRIRGSTYVDDDAYDEFLKGQAPQTGGIRQLVKDMGLTYNHWQAKPWPLAEEWHPTNWVVSESRKVVQSASLDRPLFLTASFYAPHPPLFPPKKYFDAYLQGPLPRPAHGDWVAWERLTLKGTDGGHRVLLQGQALRTSQAGYFGLIEHLDDKIGGLVQDFMSRGRKAGRPWVIVLTSDHGEMLGDHGYFRKCEPYEGSANIPLIISGSDDLAFPANRRITRPVCLEDIMPTLLSLAGAPCPDSVDGVDLTPTLRGDRQKIRDWLHFDLSTSTWVTE